MTSPSLSLESLSLTAHSSERVFDFHREEYPRFIITLNFNTTLEGLSKRLTGYLHIFKEIVEKYRKELHLDIEDFEKFQYELEEWIRDPKILGDSLADTCRHWIDQVIELKSFDDLRTAEELPEICCQIFESNFVIEHSSDSSLGSVKTALKTYSLIVSRIIEFWSHPGKPMRRFHRSLDLWLNKSREDQPPVGALKFWAKWVDRIKKEHKGAAVKNLPSIVLQEMIPLYSIRS